MNSDNVSSLFFDADGLLAVHSAVECRLYPNVHFHLCNFKMLFFRENEILS